MRFCKIKPNDVVNGEGICVSLWTMGCPHKCKGCFNKDTWKFGEGDIFTDIHTKQIIELLNKDGISRNLSVLGGEPLCSQNIEGVVQLCKEIKSIYPDKIIYLWTGYTLEEFNKEQSEILKYIDILIDGKYEEDKQDITLLLRGSSNQRVINVKESLATDKIIGIEI